MATLPSVVMLTEQDKGTSKHLAAEAMMQVFKDLAYRCETSDKAWIAGGYPRNLYYKKRLGAELQSSGDVDIVILGYNDSNFEEFADLVVAMEAFYGYTILSINTTYEGSQDDRIVGVIKVEKYGVSVDLIFYKDYFKTIQGAIASFNSPINMFFIEEDVIYGVNLLYPLSPMDMTREALNRLNLESQKSIETFGKLFVNTHIINDALAKLKV